MTLAWNDDEPTLKTVTTTSRGMKHTQVRRRHTISTTVVDVARQVRAPGPGDRWPKTLHVAAAGHTISGPAILSPTRIEEVRRPLRDGDRRPQSCGGYSSVAWPSVHETPAPVLHLRARVAQRRKVDPVRAATWASELLVLLGAWGLLAVALGFLGVLLVVGLGVVALGVWCIWLGIRP